MEELQDWDQAYDRIAELEREVKESHEHAMEMNTLVEGVIKDRDRLERDLKEAPGSLIPRQEERNLWEADFKRLQQENARLREELRANTQWKREYKLLEGAYRTIVTLNDRTQQENARLREAIGLMTTAKPSMQMDSDNPVGMAMEVVQEVARLNGELKGHEHLEAAAECALERLSDRSKCGECCPCCKENARLREDLRWCIILSPSAVIMSRWHQRIDQIKQALAADRGDAESSGGG